MSNVCANCFQDKIARRFVRQYGAIGNCDFCASKRLKVLPAYKLRDLFGELLSLYEQYDPTPGSDGLGGNTLAECLQEWEIFNEDRSEQTQNQMLGEISGFDPHDGDISASGDWQAKSDHWTFTPAHQRWPWFASYLKQSRRFIIEEDPSGDVVRPENWIPELLVRANAVFTIKQNARLYRGRTGFASRSLAPRDRLPLPVKEMTAPPPRFAKAGRANPEGISVLYCALEAETAIVETGRFHGAVISLRELRSRKQLRLADLRGQGSIIEPLGTSNLEDEVEKATLLGSLGNALAKPIHPEDSAIEYVPTQYLTEVMRSCGYDGICFASALIQKGTNIVIFDPTKVRITRRAWVFELGHADYTVHPRPKFVIQGSPRRR